MLSKEDNMKEGKEQEEDLSQMQHWEQEKQKEQELPHQWRKPAAAAAQHRQHRNKNQEG